MSPLTLSGPASRSAMTATLALLALGCGGATSQPPATSPTTQVVPPSIAPAWTSGDYQGGNGLLGLYQIQLTSLDAQPAAEVLPFRFAQAIGDTFDVDISNFLSQSPCKGCLEVTGLSLDPDNTLHMRIAMAHPFSSTTLRKDLHVFDVRGIIVAEPEPPVTIAGVPVNIGTGASLTVSPGFLKNADGYTSFFDGAVEDYLVAVGLLPVADAGTLKPYKIMWQDHTSPNWQPSFLAGFSDPDSPRGHNVFPMGGTKEDPRATTDFALQVDPSQGQIDLTLVVDAAYGQSAVRATRLAPRYFLPLFHRQEPWKVTAEVTASNLQSGSTSSNATIEVSAYDWQGTAANDPAFDASTSPLDAFRIASDIREVVLAAPDLLAAPLTKLGTDRTGTGAFTDPFVYTFIVPNSLDAAGGDYWAAIRVVDAIEGSAGPVPLNRDLSVPTFEDYATYQLVSLEVNGVPSNLAPTAVIAADDLTPAANQIVSFSPGPGTIDPDGSIVLYEYDFDYNPVIPLDFTPDATQVTTAPVTQGFPNTSPGPLAVWVAMRVTDNGAPGLTDLDYVELAIAPAPSLPIWDFENPADTLTSLGFSLLGTNGFERVPVAPCGITHNAAGVTYTVPPAGTTWGLVQNIGDATYPGNTTHRALEESGSSSPAGTDQRYYGDAIQAIRSPLINVPASPQNIYLDLHHWFQFDLDYQVGAAFPLPANPNPGLWTRYDGARVFVRSAPGGVPTGPAIPLAPIAPQTTEPYWGTFNNAIGFALNISPLSWTPVPLWIQTNWAAGVDQGFGPISYNNSVTNRAPVLNCGACSGGWGVNPAAPTWIDSRFDLSAYEGQQVVLEFRMASKKPGAAPNCGSGFLSTPICLECVQNLEALVTSSPNHRISKGWKLDRIALVEAP